MRQQNLRGTATIDRGSEADLGSIMVIWGFNICLAFRDLNNRFQKKKLKKVDFWPYVDPFKSPPDWSKKLIYLTFLLI